MYEFEKAREHVNFVHIHGCICVVCICLSLTVKHIMKRKVKLTLLAQKTRWEEATAKKNRSLRKLFSSAKSSLSSKSPDRI